MLERISGEKPKARWTQKKNASTVDRMRRFEIRDRID